MPATTFREMPCRLVPGSGLWLSEIGLGLWKWGDPEYDGSRVGDHAGFAILDRALELGAFHWDTACSYNQGSGNSERLLGRYFAARGPAVREQVVLATKIKNGVRYEHETKRAFTPNQQGASRLYIRRQVERCLRRLQTDWIDVLYLHSPLVDEQGRWVVPLEETWGAMDDLVTSGKVNYLAVSNHSATEIEQVQQALAQVGKDASRRIVLVQNSYNMLERDQVARPRDLATGQGEGDFLARCAEQRVGLVPYFPLASGALTGRYRRDTLDKVEGRITAEGTGERFLTERNLRIIEQLEPIAKDKDCSLPQLAIAYLLQREVVSSVIAGVTRLEQLEDNAAAAKVELTDADMQKIDALLAAK